MEVVGERAWAMAKAPEWRLAAEPAWEQGWVWPLERG